MFHTALGRFWTRLGCSCVFSARTTTRSVLPSKDFARATTWLLQVLPCSFFGTPPCDSSCRAHHPDGSPRLSQRDAGRAAQANNIINFTWRSCMVVGHRRQPWLTGFPEYLGDRSGGRPASAIDMDVYKELVQRPNTFTGANFQCAFGDGDRRSPTRWTGNLDGLQDFCYLGMPKVNAQGVYTGPLPTNCGHRHS